MLRSIGKEVGRTDRSANVITNAFGPELKVRDQNNIPNLNDEFYNDDSNYTNFIKDFAQKNS